MNKRPTSAPLSEERQENTDFVNSEVIDDKELWGLLAQSPAPQASAFFSRNVQRQIRLDEAAQEEMVGSLWARIFTKPRTFGSLSAAIVCVAVVIGMLSLKNPSDDGQVALSADSAPAIALDHETITQSETIIATVIDKEELSEMQDQLSELSDQFLAIASQDSSILFDQDLIAYLY